MITEFERSLTGKKLGKRKFLLSIVVIIIVGIFSLNLTLAIMNNQPGILYSSNNPFPNTIAAKTTDGTFRLNYTDTLYHSSDKILHLWPCQISPGQNGIIVYSDEGVIYNLTAIEPGITPVQRWQISFSSPISYCWVADFSGNGYDDLAVKVAGGNLTIYNGVNGNELSTFDIGSSVVSSVDWDNDSVYEILLFSPPVDNGTHSFINITFIDDVTSPVLDNSTYYLNQTDSFNFAVYGDWDLSSPGVEVVLMDKTGNSIYILRNNDWVRSKTEMVNASVIILPGGATFSNLFDFRSPYFAFYMSGSDVGVFYNTSIRWTTSRSNPYIKLVQLDTGVKLLTTYPKSSWSKNYTIYNALTGSIESEGQIALTASHSISNDNNKLIAQLDPWGYSSTHEIFQTDFSSSQPATHETLLRFNFYISPLYIMDSVLHLSTTVFGDEQLNYIRFFTYLRDFNGDGKMDMLGIREYGVDRYLRLYTLEKSGLPTGNVLFFNLFNIALYINGADLKNLGIGLGILVMGIALASVYYIRKRRAFKR